MTRSRTEMTAGAGVLCSCLSLVLVLAAPTAWLSLAGTLMLAGVPAGAAVMSWIDCGDGAAQAGLTLAVSLTVLALACALMIWTSDWHPRALLVLAVVGVISCGLRLRQRRGVSA